MTTKLSHLAAALLLIGPAGITTVQAQPAPAYSRAPVVQSMQLSADNGLAPGSLLQFTVQGTPRSTASVQLNDTGIVVGLGETSPGTYQGSYALRGGDRVDARGLMRATVTNAGLSNTVNYTFPPSFIAWQNDNGRGGPPPVAAGPAIERFTAVLDGPLEPGAQVRFAVRGQPGADASLNIPGVARNIELEEVRPGVYRGSYTVRREDNPRSFAEATAVLRSGNQTSRASLSEPFMAGHMPQPDRTMGAAPMSVLQPLVLSHKQNDPVDASNTTVVRGRTMPFATVRIKVDAVPPLTGQRLAVAQQLVSETVQADAQGNFSFDLNARALSLPGTRYEVLITAVNGPQSAESRLTLFNRS